MVTRSDPHLAPPSRRGGIRVGAAQVALPALAAVAGCLLQAAGAEASPVSAGALAEAARSARLAALDPSAAEDHGDRTIGAWLADLTRGKARSIAWSGGRCRLGIPESPRDAGGSGARCGRAVIRLARPQGRGDQPEIEIYFNLPSVGGPLEAYAFRGAIRSRDGDEYIRFPRDFEAVWRERFGAQQQRR